MSKTAKIVISVGLCFLIYFVYNTISRENIRKEKLNAIGQHFKSDFEVDEKLKEQYNDTFQVKVKGKVYIVTIPKDKVTKVEEVKQP
ncbi:hypothetical protein ACFQPF_03065 [Fictibacillus iocasae]|uniref:PepSY domain-containing protein n=1 Tax=Fictibacillus iocasae TaxID=2715437 RepID=A0ABW2NJ11_9BACL